MLIIAKVASDCNFSQLISKKKMCIMCRTRTVNLNVIKQTNFRQFQAVAPKIWKKTSLNIHMTAHQKN